MVMTDKMNDDELLRAFFADHIMEDIPDDGFSDRVMASLPSWETEKITVVRQKMERLWTVVCVLIGTVFLFAFQGWSYLQDTLFHLKLSFVLNGSRILCQTVDALSQSSSLWMMLVSVVVLTLVWGYNELMDARP